ncbi:MAG TPA: hypothetical protein VL371_12850 [Gemmataceae bacterium]|nr:hypothetical protein [Gemmataceae bacterium]
MDADRLPLLQRLRTRDIDGQRKIDRCVRSAVTNVEMVAIVRRHAG